ncbi:MAG: sigma-70 family RNA polymerase sigma factor [Marinilabilia sp.]
MNQELFPEEELIEGCKEGKRYHQELLYRRFAPKMYGVCLSYAKNRDQAKDILHDAFLKVFRSIKSYKHEGSFEGWIRRIVANTAIDHVRSASKTLGMISDEIPDIPEEEPEDKENIKFSDLMALVERLPDGARMVFNLYTLEGMTHMEIASRLNITVGTSKSQFNRARRMLQDWVKEFTKGKHGLS